MDKMISYVKCFWLNAFNFSGRTNLEQAFMPGKLNGLILSLVGIALGIVFGLLCLIKPLATIFGIIGILAALAVSLTFCIASLSCTIRRLHDAGHRWFCIFLVLIPIAGIFILLYFLLQDSSPNGLGEPTMLEGEEMNSFGSGYSNNNNSGMSQGMGNPGESISI